MSSLNLIGVALAALVSSSQAAETIVWNVGTPYPAMTLNQGDTVTFTWTEGHREGQDYAEHNLYKFENEAKFDSCDFTRASETTLYY